MASNGESKKRGNILMDAGELYARTISLYEKNKKVITGVVIAIIAVILVYYGYKNWYLAPMNKEANNAMFMAENYLEQDSLNRAINGYAQYKGFEDIVNDYSGTKAANLAHYYLGMAYLKKGDYKKAISNLKDFSSDDVFLGTMALGARGDANVELKNLSQAADLYSQAAERQANDFTSPIYLMKAGQVYEKMGKYDEALKMYKKIQDNYQKSEQARTIQKYITRAKILAKK